MRRKRSPGRPAGGSLPSIQTTTASKIASNSAESGRTKASPPSTTATAIKTNHPTGHPPGFELPNMARV